MRSKLPTQAILQEWFDYNPATGIFVWRKEPRPMRPCLGVVAGTTTGAYVLIKVPGFRCQFGAHRLAWIYMNGLTIGGAEIDHKDNNPSNNAIGNLRLATSTEQKQNKKVQSNNISGLKGAFFHACRTGKKWRSQIKVGERLIFLGYFSTAEEAHEAYGRAAIEHYGEFARIA